MRLAFCSLPCAIFVTASRIHTEWLAGDQASKKFRETNRIFWIVSQTKGAAEAAPRTACRCRGGQLLPLWSLVTGLQL